jgi:hypothetical protein
MEVMNKNWAAIIIVVLFLCSGILTLQIYGLSWDEGLGNIFFGERYYLYLTSLDTTLLDFKAELPYHNQTPINTYSAPFRDSPNEFPPVTDLFSAASMHLLSYQFKWFDPVDGWHFFTVVLAAGLLAVLYYFFSVRVGKWESLLGIFFLAVFPRFWGDMHFNPKDIPVVVWISFVIVLYVLWYQKPTSWKSLAVGVTFSFALGTKVNSLIVPLILVAGVWPWQDGLKSVRTNVVHIKDQLPHYFLMLGSFLGFYYLLWPYLHGHPERILGYYNYVLFQGGRAGSGINFEIWLQLVSTMPIVMLICLVVGVIFLLSPISNSIRKWANLLIIWFLFPLLRASSPGMVNFDGIRHFLEFLPAASIIAGYGGVQLVRWIPEKISLKQSWVTAGFSGLLVANTLFIHAWFFPFQHLYYNKIIGGLSGASKVFGENEATDYWATSYRNGMEWLEQNISGEAFLYTPVAPWLVDLAGPLWLSEQIEIVNEISLNSYQQSFDKPIYVMFITRPVFYDRVARYCEDDLDPIYTIKIDGIDLLYIYQLE